MVSDQLLLATPAARLVSEVSGRPITADGLRMHDAKLEPTRIAGGVRLYHRDRLVRFAEMRRNTGDSR